MVDMMYYKEQKYRFACLGFLEAKQMHVYLVISVLPEEMG